MLLFRSTDDGANWDVVLSLPDGIPHYANAQLVLSPQFATDGLAFAVIGGLDPLPGQSVLARSTDAGASWSLLDPAPGRWIRQVVFSPTFGLDGKILLVTSNLLTDPGGPTTSISGSKDGGSTWSAVADNLAYHDLQLVPTADLGDAESLFASMGGSLARSDDGGASWQHLKGGLYSSLAGPPSVGLSPTFSQDGIGLIAGNGTLGHGTKTCALQGTSDGGATWTSLGLQPPQAEEVAARLGCGQVHILQGPHGLIELLNVGTFGWLLSDSAGQNWRILAAPDGQPAALVASANNAFPTDPTLFVATSATAGFQSLWTVELH